MCRVKRNSKSDGPLFQQYLSHICQIFGNDKSLSKYLTDKKLKTSSLFFEIKGAKEDKTFKFLKGRFSIIGGPTDMMFCMF